MTEFVRALRPALTLQNRGEAVVVPSVGTAGSHDTD